MTIFDAIGYFLFLFAATYYIATNLQWYGYRLGRVVFHHTKVWWHLVYFLVPYLLYETVAHTTPYGVIVAFLYGALILQWRKGLDKGLVFTSRVKRFFAATFFIALFLYLLLQTQVVIFPIAIGWGVSVLFEKILFEGYKRKAQAKLESMRDLHVVGITASYGKTSIKNFIAHLLGGKYRTYATPRSVNTFGGVIKDINDDLPQDTQVYVVEMGARGKGDIQEIATFVNPHIGVVGRIGPAHIEYFKSLENIRNTKMEMIRSNRLEKLFVHESALVRPDEKVEIYGTGERLDTTHALPAPKYRIEDIEATLEATSFTLEGVRYNAPVLGGFNAENLAVAILVAKALGVDEESIRERLATIKPIPHRLQRIEAGGKLILDDSFNGNIDGMLAAFDLAATHQGRKVLITPGLVEADEELNRAVAKRANEVFDLVIVTGDLNWEIFRKEIQGDKLEKLRNKAEMERILAQKTKAGDLILFANDAPSFV